MIRWGIIGCGNVTELKSGPAFNKVPQSSLAAVMRRDMSKAADYASRHHVSKWYNDAYSLINDAEVGAIYIATPPSSHEEYALAAINAKKPVYIEKPFAMNAASAKKIAETAKAHNIKVSVAHYRRQMPIFLKIKELIDQHSIGDILNVNIIFSQHGSNDSTNNWRIDPTISGGGYFHDLAPHQLDLMTYFFKPPVVVKGLSLNQANRYKADDGVACTMLFENGALLTGLWSFSVAEEDEADECVITGTEGTIRFSIFGMKKITVSRKGIKEELFFEPLQHVQQPMIAKVVEYFSDRGPNPCSADEAQIVMSMIDDITKK